MTIKETKVGGGLSKCVYADLPLHMNVITKCTSLVG